MFFFPIKHVHILNSCNGDWHMGMLYLQGSKMWPKFFLENLSSTRVGIFKCFKKEEAQRSLLQTLRSLITCNTISKLVNFNSISRERKCFLLLECYCMMSFHALTWRICARKQLGWIWVQMNASEVLIWVVLRWTCSGGKKMCKLLFFAYIRNQ
jgi:hypothetical protein